MPRNIQSACRKREISRIVGMLLNGARRALLLASRFWSRGRLTKGGDVHVAGGESLARNFRLIAGTMTVWRHTARFALPRSRANGSLLCHLMIEKRGAGGLRVGTRSVFTASPLRVWKRDWKLKKDAAKSAATQLICWRRAALAWIIVTKRKRFAEFCVSNATLASASFVMT
jgi:hypothetical protein